MANQFPVALIGYGRMGHMLHQMAADYGCEVVAAIDPHSPEAHSELTKESIGGARVGIVFSLPGVVMQNIRAGCGLGLPLVVGTTGWNQHLSEVQELVRASDTALIHGANFSVGMNAFYAIADAAAQLMNRLPAYDPYCLELHHRGKADSPSGTAGALAQILLSRIDRKRQAQPDRVQRVIEDEELHVASVRAGSIPGTHLVGFDSPADTIELKHTARDRSGFAAGALLAARWIAGRKGVYDFRDVFHEIIGA